MHVLFNLTDTQTTTSHIHALKQIYAYQHIYVVEMFLIWFNWFFLFLMNLLFKNRLLICFRQKITLCVYMFFSFLFFLHFDPIVFVFSNWFSDKDNCKFCSTFLRKFYFSWHFYVFTEFKWEIWSLELLYIKITYF